MKYRYREDIEMKDSGIEWIGKIPKNYNLEPLKKYFLFEKGKNAGMYTGEYIGKNEGKYPVYSGQTENEGIMGLINSYEYDLEECLFTTTVGAKVMTVSYLRGKFTLSQNCLIMINNKNQICTKYIYYYLQGLFRYEKSSIPSYMQPSLRIEDLKKYRILFPFIKEQEKISNFLDEKTSQFDSIISKKEALIQKLEETKKSLISEVVTGKVKVVKNSDGYELVKRSSGEMKDSGAEWLGEIPKDWEAKRIKYLFEIKKNIAKALGYDVLSVTQSGIKIKDITKNEGQLSMDYSKYQIVDIGDFVMNHMDLLTGFVDCSKFNGVTSPDYRVFKLIDSNNCKQYYNYIFQSCYHNRIFYSLAQGVSGMGRWRLQTDTFKNFIIPMPSFKEQEKIALVLTNKIKDIDKLKNKLVVNIQKLKEAKQSLISETVTGKIEILD